MPAEHFRPDGSLAQGYFCLLCGASGVNMYGTDHGHGKCEPNPELVKALLEANNRPAQKGPATPLPSSKTLTVAQLAQIESALQGSIDLLQQLADQGQPVWIELGEARAALKLLKE
jgi:hypothetical protein